MATKAEQAQFIEYFQTAVVEQATTTLRKYGSVPPIFSFALQTADGGFGIAPITLASDEFGEEEKDLLFELAIPELFAGFRQQGSTPLCFASAYEAWMRWAKVSDNVGHNGWLSEAQKAELPKKEVLIVNCQTLTHNSSWIYELLRPDGQAVNVAGELVEQVTLELLNRHELGPNVEVGGRMMNVFRHYQA